MNITNEMKKELISILKMKKLFGISYIDKIEQKSKKMLFNELPNVAKDLEEYVINCNLCELSKSKELTLLGKGDVNSKIYIVGIDYNFHNEKEFVMIKNMCEKVLELNINDIYMTNIIKCISTKKKLDLDVEIKTCLPYLEHNIAISTPKIILTLGSAFKYLMKNDDDIMDITANKFYYNGILLLPLLDPLFISRNPSYKEKMFNDLKKIKKIMDDK